MEINTVLTPLESLILTIISIVVGYTLLGIISYINKKKVDGKDN